MLQNLLSLLQDTRTHSLADLARALDTSIEMVEAMLQDLERMGYVRQVTGCNRKCHGCSSKSACTPGGSARIWALTER